MIILYFFIALFSSIIGAISGIGGGIIIKPMMDAISGLENEVINFMSASTVLAMSFSSYFRGRNSETDIDMRITFPLAIGGAIGGLIGSTIFSLISGNIILVQSFLLFALNIGVLLYTLNKSRIKTYNVNNKIYAILIGMNLGMVSSFLGIGGGPMNIMVLHFFFTMSPKVIVKNSLFIILLSQITNIGNMLFTIPLKDIDSFSLILMMLGGVVGAIIGSKFSKNMSNKNVDSFFMIVLVGLIALNSYNILNLLY